MDGTNHDNASLFQRLGGSQGIAGLVDEIVAAHMANPLINARFLPVAREPQRLEVIKGHLRAFLEMGSGGRAQYAGRSMPDAHRGMNISATEYMAAMDDILAVLRARGIDERTRNDVLAIAYSLKADIMHL